MKTLDDAVIEFGGIWPEGAEVLLTTGDEWGGDVEVSGRIIAGDKPYNDYGYTFMDQSIQGYAIIGSSAWIVLCRMNEFQQRAIERGFINGYRWGVEYDSNDSKPNLEGGIEIEWRCKDSGREYWTKTRSESFSFTGGFHRNKSFKVTDPRHQPADTSYLEKPALDPVPEEECWYTYEMNVANQPAPVGTKVLVDCHHQGMKKGIVIGAFQRWNWIDVQGFAIETFDMILVKPLDHDRKAVAERKKVVDAAYAAIATEDGVGVLEAIRGLYDKGFLKQPE